MAGDAPRSIHCEYPRVSGPGGVSPFVSTGEAVRLLGLPDLRALRRWVDLGRLRPLRPRRGELRFRRVAVLEALLKSRDEGYGEVEHRGDPALG